MAKLFSYGICLYKIEEEEILIYLNKTSSISDWNFFKGKMEDNETFEETAIREMFEETNILVKKKHLEDLFEQTNKKKNMGVYLVDYNVIDFKKLLLDKKEIFEGKWLNIKDKIIVSKNQKKILNKLTTSLFQKYNYIKYIKV